MESPLLVVCALVAREPAELRELRASASEAATVGAEPKLRSEAGEPGRPPAADSGDTS